MLDHGQFDTRSRSGQNRSNFNVRISEKNGVYLIQLLILSSLVLFLIPVGGLQTPRKGLQKKNVTNGRAAPGRSSST